MLKAVMLTGLFFLLFLTGVTESREEQKHISDEVSSEQNCSYQAVLNHLKMTRTNELYSMTRPVRNYRRPTQVSLEVLLFAILDVVEKDQKFIPFVWTVMRWHNEYISWDRNQFCGIDNVSLPAETLWKPDLTIEEMIERDKAPATLYITMNDKGYVEYHNDLVLVSTCRMRVYKFPFDIQKCNLSFKSFSFTIKDIRLQPSDNSSEATEWSRELMRTQYEWLFINLTVIAINGTKPLDQDVIVYTITMQRRAALYIVNFLVPVLFFLSLDLSSFLIADNGNEKLSFKITVLLALTVLQLILNEILPASSNRIPLIVIYCIGIFGLMLLSLVETIFVMYLMDKDSVSQDETDQDGSLREDYNKHSKVHFSSCHDELQKWTRATFVYTVSAGETPPEQLPVVKQDNGCKLTEEYQALERLSDALKEMEKTLSLLLHNRKDEEKPGYWTRVAKRVNRVFLIFYVTMVSVFLACIFINWSIP
ncbi:5-hydroxytryptamine receptor 3A-like [Amphiprion ocellaris]|uniref:5-hydroxytryptamine receptor 3A-like n=1 Tax=Amphiprion ocellaris TaxID=80972 RepID=A0AAQ5ZVV8_AMPOC|nr:5-hydroxytryptamine receptor 3A-like [Amphiprion ocellaris]